MIKKIIAMQDFNLDEFVEDVLYWLEEQISEEEDIHPSYYINWLEGEDKTIHKGSVKGRTNFKEQLYDNKKLFFPYINTFSFLTAEDWDEAEVKGEELEELNKNYLQEQLDKGEELEDLNKKNTVEYLLEHLVDDDDDFEMPPPEIYIGLLLYVEAGLLVIKAVGRLLQEDGSYGEIITIDYNDRVEYVLNKYIDVFINC